MTFIGKNWFSLLLIGMLIFIVIRSQFKIDTYKREIKIIEARVDSLNKQIQIDLKVIDSLKKADTVYIDRIKKIKVKTDEKIKLVDTMSVSDMQSFYSDRYPEK